MPIFKHHGSVVHKVSGKFKKTVSKDGLISLPEKVGREMGLEKHSTESIRDDFPEKTGTRKATNPEGAEGSESIHSSDVGGEQGDAS